MRCDSDVVQRSRHTEVAEGHSTLSFERGSGSLRFARNRRLVVQLEPPHSWTYIASIANNPDWGTRPSQADLALVLCALNEKHSCVKPGHDFANAALPDKCFFLAPVIRQAKVALQIFVRGIRRGHSSFARHILGRGSR